MSKFQKSRPFQILSNYCISTVSTVSTVSTPDLAPQCVLLSWPRALAVVDRLGGAENRISEITGDHWMSLDVHVITVITRTKPVHFTGQQMRISKNWNPMTQKKSTLYPNMINIHQQNNHSFSRGNLANLPFSPDELRIL